MSQCGTKKGAYTQSNYTCQPALLSRSYNIAFRHLEMSLPVQKGVEPTPLREL